MKKHVQFNLRMDEAMREGIRVAAEDAGCSASDLVRGYISEGLALTSRPFVQRNIWFLPSWEGAGHYATILFDTPNAGPHGWDASLNGGLRGVILRPEERERYLDLAVEHLADQGVHVLSRSEARRYMDREGCYWSFKHGVAQCPADLAPRQPEPMEWLRWMVMRPATPLHDTRNAKKYVSAIFDEATG